MSTEPVFRRDARLLQVHRFEIAKPLLRLGEIPDADDLRRVELLGLDVGPDDQPLAGELLAGDLGQVPLVNNDGVNLPALTSFRMTWARREVIRRSPSTPCNNSTNNSVSANVRLRWE